jgi:hypothetical protein
MHLNNGYKCVDVHLKLRHDPANCAKKNYSILYYLLYCKNNKLPIFVQYVVFICVILGQSISIYDYHHWRWLLYGAHDDSVCLLQQSYYDKLYLTPVMEGRGWWHTFGSC